MRTQRRFRLFATFTMFAVTLVFTRVAIAATTITVNSSHDDVTINGNCTLREAILAANTDAPVDACPAGSGADAIVLPAGVYILSLTGPCDDASATGDLDIAGELTIVGAGAANTVIHGGSLPYPLSDRVIHVLDGSHLMLSGVTVRGGVSGVGGGIFNAGTLVVETSQVRHNIVSYDGGDACYMPRGLGGAGIYNSGELTVRDSTVWGNAVWGANRGDVDSPGGGLLNSGNATIEDSTFSGNWAAGGAGIANGGVLLVVDSHLSGNAARFWGAGLENGGQATLTRTTVDRNVDSGIYNAASATLTLFDSTVSHNEGYRIAGGIINEGTLDAVNSTISGNDGPVGGVAGWGPVNLAYCTIADNSGWNIGGIENSRAEVRLSATIVAHNVGSPADCSGAITSLGYNLDSDGSCGLSGPGDLPNASAALGLLVDNGGPTFTHALLAGSPAIDAIPVEMCATAADQRGVSRPDGAGCDIGAYEAVYAELPGPLSIDVRPKSDVNTVDLASTNPVSVAILSAPNFDAPKAVSRESLRFGRTGDEDSLRRVGSANRPACGSIDVSGDGVPDLVCTFSVAATGFQCGDKFGVLKANPVGIGAVPLVAQDVVVIKPCD